MPFLGAYAYKGISPYNGVMALLSPKEIRLISLVQRNRYASKYGAGKQAVKDGIYCNISNAARAVRDLSRQGMLKYDADGFLCPTLMGRMITALMHDIIEVEEGKRFETLEKSISEQEICPYCGQGKSTNWTETAAYGRKAPSRCGV
jgi:hypothetical protein